MVLGPPGHQIMYFWGKATDFCATDYTSGRPNNPVYKDAKASRKFLQTPL